MNGQLTAITTYPGRVSSSQLRRMPIMAKITKEYCSQFNSYNGDPVTKGKVLAPFVVPDYLYENDDTIIKSNLRRWYQFGITVTVGFMVVDETDFDKLLHIFNITVNEQIQERHNPGRCLLGVRNNGLPRLCPMTNKCTGCPNRSSNLPRYKNSSDYITRHAVTESLTEDGAYIPFEIPDSSTSVEDEAIVSLMASQLIKYLENYSPRYASIVSLALKGLTKEEIIEALDLKPSRGYEEIRNAKNLAKMFLYS